MNNTSGHSPSLALPSRPCKSRSFPRLALRSCLLLLLLSGMSAHISGKPRPVGGLFLLGIGQEYDLAVPGGRLRPVFDFHYSYTGENTATRYLNLFVRDSATGQKIWAIENLALDGTDTVGNGSYPMALRSLYPAGQRVYAAGVFYSLSDTIRVNPVMPDDSLFQRYEIGEDSIAIGNGNHADSTLHWPADTTQYVNAWNPTAADSVIQHRKMPNIDLDSAAHGVGGGYAGDWNACGPAACANSLQWLENTRQVKFDSVLTHRQKMEALSQQMKRPNREGVFGAELIKGKLGFADRYRLPIVVRFQDASIGDSLVYSPDTTYRHFARNANRNRTDTNKNHIGWDFLWQEMKQDKDVEIWFNNRDMIHNKWCGFSHFVVVTEVSVRKNVLRLKYREDQRQDRPGMGDLEEVPITIDTTGDGRLYVKEWDWYFCGRLTDRTFITAVYSEGFDSSIKFTGSKPLSVSGPQDTKLDVRISNNPLTGSQPLTVQFKATPGQPLEIAISDQAGRVVRVYSGTTQTMNRFSWKGDAGSGMALSPGIYWLRIRAGNATTVVKVMKK